MKNRLSVLVVAMALASSVNGATISFSDTITKTTTNWTDAFTLQQFDSSLGTLVSITFSYSGAVDSTFRVESLDAAPATVTANLNANLVFGVPLSDTLNIANSYSQLLTAFDGTIDFGGTSGFGPKTVSGSQSDSLTLLAGFAPYVGLGTYDITVLANGLSNSSGSGNLITSIQTLAGADITVTYDYTARTRVPEPATLALLGLGLAGLGFSRRKQ